MKTLSRFVAILTVFCCFESAAQSSQTRIDSLQNILETTVSDTLKIRLYHQLASSYPEDQFNTSLELEQKGLALAQKIESDPHLIAAYTHVGAHYRRHSNYLQAISNLRMAIAHSKDPANDKALTNTYLEIGIACLRMMKLDSAQLHLETGLNIATTNQDERMQASFYNMIGNVLKEQRNFQGAIDHYLKATVMFEKLKDDRGLTQTLSNIGNLENIMGNYDKAEQYALQSLSIAEKLHQQTSIAYSNRLLGRIYRKQKKFDRAAQVYETAIKIYTELDSKRDLAETFLAKGNIFYEKSDFKSAVAEYRRCLKINKLIYDSTNMTYAYAALGGASFEMKQSAQSIRYYDSAVLVGKRIGLSALVMDSYGGLSTVYASSGNYKRAHEYTLLFTALKDSLAQVENRQAAAELEAKYQNEKKENEIRTLNAENEVKALQLQKQSNQRNYLIGIIVLSLLLIAVLYNRYTIKQKASKKLEELDEIKSRFFANISHEFRTPLSLIIGPLQQKIEATTDAREKDELMLMKRNADRLHSLINQLLDLSKIESGSMKVYAEEANAIEFLKVMHSSFSSLADQKKIDYQFERKTESITGFYDRDKLEKIMYNLLSNAFKFTPDYGTITIVADEENEHLIVRVNDTGPGIPADKLSKVFDRFYQVDDTATRVAGGTGVGLALSKELAEVHHGTLTVKSSEGNGCEFLLRLPLSLEFYKNEIANGQPVESSLSLSEFSVAERFSFDTDEELPMVMIAEDNNDMQTFIADVLRSKFRITTADDGKDALERAIVQVPDLIITDWMMPKMDGQELCAQLKTHKATSHIPVIMLTAKADQQSKLEGLETGADDYLIKPFDAKELNIRVANLIEQRKKLRDLFRQQLTLHPKDASLKSPDAEFLTKVLKLMEDHYTNPLFGVQEFTVEIGLSRMQLHRKLKALTDSSPGDFLRQFRLEKAKQLLKLPGIQVSEVAYKTGFNNLSNFTKAFKDFTGLTPSEFR